MLAEQLKGKAPGYRRQYREERYLLSGYLEGVIRYLTFIIKVIEIRIQPIVNIVNRKNPFGLNALPFLKFLTRQRICNYPGWINRMCCRNV